MIKYFLTLSLGLVGPQSLLAAKTASSRIEVMPTGKSDRSKEVELDMDAFADQVTRQLNDHERRLVKIEKTSQIKETIPAPPSKMPTTSAAATETVMTRPPAQTYVSKKGDSWAAVAKKYQVSVSDLQKANKATAKTPLKAGQTLVIPAKSAATTEVVSQSLKNKETTEGKIQSGDTIAKIAKRYGVSPEALMKANGWNKNTVIISGHKVKIPGRAPVTDERPETKSGANVSSLPHGWQWHEVKRGQSLSAIAAQYGLERRALEVANGLHSSNHIQAGMKLKVPPASAMTEVQSQSAPKKNSQPTLLGYPVAKGDTVDSVAREFKTTPEEIRKLNRMAANEPLVVGRRIVVPSDDSF